MSTATPKQDAFPGCCIWFLLLALIAAAAACGF